MFSLEPHPWCFSEFFLLHHFSQSTPEAPIYIFCGQKSSWTMVYTKNTMKVWIATRRTSTLDFKFQINDPQNIDTFHIYQYYITDQEPCFHKIHPNSLITHAFKYQRKQTKVSSFVVSIAVLEHQKMKILKSTNFDFIFDGPTIDHKKMPIRNGLLMSSFQATVMVTDFKFLLNNDLTAVFIGIDLVTKNYHSSLIGSKLVLNKSCDKLNCLVHEAYWLGTQHAFTITFINATYSGPREPVTKHYAGISVYELRYTTKLPHNILKISPDNTLELYLENFTYTVDPSWEYPQNLVIAYYYYSQFSFLKGEFSISKTKCPGYQLNRNRSLTTCEFLVITPRLQTAVLF